MVHSNDVQEIVSSPGVIVRRVPCNTHKFWRAVLSHRLVGNNNLQRFGITKAMFCGVSRSWGISPVVVSLALHLPSNWRRLTASVYTSLNRLTRADENEHILAALMRIKDIACLRVNR